MLSKETLWVKNFEDCVALRKQRRIVTGAKEWDVMYMFEVKKRSQFLGNP